MSESKIINQEIDKLQKQLTQAPPVKEQSKEEKEICELLQSWYDSQLVTSLKSSRQMMQTCTEHKIPFNESKFCDLMETSPELFENPKSIYNIVHSWLMCDDVITNEYVFNYHSIMGKHPAMGGTSIQFDVDLKSMTVVELFDKIKYILYDKLKIIINGHRKSYNYRLVNVELTIGSSLVSIVYIDENASCAGHHIMYRIRETKNKSVSFAIN